jgi:tetratricopeptide (TPR) repeat protein
VTRAAREERANRYAEAADAYERAASLTANEMVARSALYRSAQAAERAGQTDRALRLDLYLADEFPGTPEAGRGLYDAAALRHRLGDDDEAIRLYRRLVHDQPAAALAEVALRRLYQIHRDWGDLAAFDALLTEEIVHAGDDPLVAPLLYYRALGRADLGRIRDALADLDDAVPRCPYPRCSFWDDLPWQAARIAYEAGDHRAAVGYLDRLLDHREECWFNGSYYSVFYDDAQRMKAEILRDDLADPRAAADAFLELTDFTDSPLRDDGVYEAALIYLDRLDDAGRGCDMLRDLIADYPDSNRLRKARARLESPPCR